MSMWCPKRRRTVSSEDERSAIHGSGGDEVKVIRVGSRKSKLAMIQANLVIGELDKFDRSEGCKFELKTMTTTGDHILDSPLSQIGSKALFTKELEEGLLNGTIDFVVHSLKDLPTSLPNNLCIAAILERENPDDALVLKNQLKLEEPFQLIKAPLDGDGANFQKWLTANQIKEPIVIGTSSLRRIAQLKSYNSSIEAEDIRGNLDTRIRKLDDPKERYSALILAYAGLVRSGYGNRISHKLDKEWWYAVGQGALAVECRRDDAKTIGLLSPLINCKTTFEIIAERVFMAQLEGGCSVPLGVRCTWDPSEVVNEDFDDHQLSSIKLTLHGAVFSLDGTKAIKESESANLLSEVDDSDNIIEVTKHFTSICLPPETAPCYAAVKRNFINSARIGIKLAEKFKSLGAMEILNEIRTKKDQDKAQKESILATTTNKATADQ